MGVTAVGGASKIITWVVKRGSKGVCALWSVAGLAGAEKRKTRADKTKGSKRYVVARG